MSTDSFPDDIKSPGVNEQPAKIGDEKVQDWKRNLIIVGLVFFLLGFLANGALVGFLGSKSAPGSCPSVDNGGPAACGETEKSPQMTLFDLTTTTSKMDTGNKALAFLSAKFLKSQGIAGELKSVEAYGDDLFKVSFTLKKDGLSQDETVYVTKDGKLILLGDGGGIMEMSDVETLSTPSQVTPATTPAHTNANIDISDAAYVFGREDAQVVMVEFNDFQCPFCKRFRDETFDMVVKEYGDRIRYVFMDFPITNIHPQAFSSHMAARCAGDQGKYLEYHDKLFLNQRTWSAFAPDSPEEIDELKKYAKELSLEAETFNSCLDSRKYSEEVLSNMQKGVNAGVTGTPTFFINGQKVVGAQPFSKFQEVIGNELRRIG